MDRLGVAAGLGRLGHWPFRHLEARPAQRPIIVRAGGGARERNRRREGE